MASLMIHDLDAGLQARLETRARAHHRSIEEEAREMLRAAIARDAGARPQDNLLAVARRIFGPERGLHLDLPVPCGAPERPAPDFSDPAYDR